MTCAPGPATFRLLDRFVGWDERAVVGLVGLEDPGGIRLAYAEGPPAGPRRHELLPWFPDRRLALGCGPCAWYLAAPARLLRRDPCHGGFEPVWPPDCDPGVLGSPVAVAARGHVLAAADAAKVLVWRRDGGHLVGEIALLARALALTSRGELLVATAASTDLERFDLAGGRRGRIRTGIPGRIEAVVTGRGGTIWVLGEDGGALAVWTAERDGGTWRQATPDELAAAVSRTTLTLASDEGFCLTEPGEDGDPASRCFTWHGQPLAAQAPRPPALAATGELRTRALDSGLPRCRWHRVRVDADVPDGTRVSLAVATSEQDGLTDIPDAQWQTGPAGARDFLIDRPPGRYLYLRLRLDRDRPATPALRRVRLDFPRVTSADLLPAVFRQDPAADDFTERFLSLFDASLEELDRAVERHPALLAGDDVPAEVLPWLAGLLGLGFDPGWDTATRRRLLAAAPELYRRRGTPWALREVIRIVFKVEPVIQELAGERGWAALNRDSRLRSARLFGRSTARFRLGGSGLSKAPLRGFGNPDDDPLTAQANRVRVLLPPARGGRQPDRAAVTSLVARQAPAHTVTQVRLGGLGFVVGVWSAVGVDTAFTPLPAPVLGRDAGDGRAVRLRRHSVLRPGPAGPWDGVQVGVRSAVGIHTTAE